MNLSLDPKIETQWKLILVYSTSSCLLLSFWIIFDQFIFCQKISKALKLFGLSTSIKIESGLDMLAPVVTELFATY